jgi:hypothetical protein
MTRCATHEGASTAACRRCEAPICATCSREWICLQCAERPLTPRERLRFWSLVSALLLAIGCAAPLIPHAHFAVLALPLGLSCGVTAMVREPLHPLGTIMAFLNGAALLTVFVLLPGVS